MCRNSPVLGLVIGVQPFGPTRRIPVCDDTRIVPSRFHAPKLPRPTPSHSVSVPPAATSTRWTLLEVLTYTIHRLSGDQNGSTASSVFGTGCAVSESRWRTHSRIFPDVSFAVNASFRPSGEMAHALV